MALAPPRQRPRHAHDHLPLAEAPEVDAHADEVVQARVRGLVQEEGGEGAERVDEEPGLDAAVHGRQPFCEDARRSWRVRAVVVGVGVLVAFGFWCWSCCCGGSRGGGGEFLGGVVVGGRRGGGLVVIYAGGGGGRGEEGEGPLPAEAEEAEEEVDDLEDRDGADGVVEVGGEEVPEHLWPEEGEDGGGGLVCF